MLSECARGRRDARRRAAALWTPAQGIGDVTLARQGEWRACFWRAEGVPTTLHLARPPCPSLLTCPSMHGRCLFEMQARLGHDMQRVHPRLGSGRGSQVLSACARGRRDARAGGSALNACRSSGRMPLARSRSRSSRRAHLRAEGVLHDPITLHAHPAPLC